MSESLESYQRDRTDPRMLHLDSRKRFRQFYEGLGEMEPQSRQRYNADRMDFVQPCGSNLVELGCHIGFNLIYFARKGFEVVGVDISDSLLALARQQIAQEPREVRARILLVQDWIEECLLGRQFDNVILTETLEHVIDPVSIMETVARLISPDGLVFISAPTKRIGNYAHVRGISKKYLMSLLTQAGLRPMGWPAISTGHIAVVARRVL